MVPLHRGDRVVKGPHWHQDMEEGEVVKVEEGQVKVRWSFFDRSWHVYCEARKGVVSHALAEEVRMDMKRGKKRDGEEKEEQKV